MATHASAIKAAKQAEKRRARNQTIISRCKTTIRKARAAVNTKYASKDAAQKALTPVFNELQSVLMKAVSKNVLKRGTASRYIARVNTKLHALTH